MNIIIVVIVVLITTSLIIPSHSWDIGHGGISPYLNRKTTDHDDQANRPMTPSELLKEENVVTSQFPWFKTKKIALENCKKNPKCTDKQCRSIRKISNLTKCNTVGGALCATRMVGYTLRRPENVDGR